MHLLVTIQPDGDNLKALIPAVPYYSLVTVDLPTLYTAIKQQISQYVRGYKKEMGEPIKIRKFNPAIYLEVNADTNIAVKLFIFDDLKEGIDFIYEQ